MKEAASVILQLCLIFSVIGFLWYHGYGHHIACAWLIPGRLALGLLSFSFDYLPHRPHTVEMTQNPYKATAVTSLFKQCTWMLTWPLLYQNYHNIHHLWPYLPFYYYARVWHSKKDQLVELGTEIIPIINNK